VIAPKWINFELHRKDMTQLEAVLTKAVAMAGEKAGKHGSFLVLHETLLIDFNRTPNAILAPTPCPF